MAITNKPKHVKLGTEFDYVLGHTLLEVLLSIKTKNIATLCNFVLNLSGILSHNLYQWKLRATMDQ
jgi:hypothetical protein